VVQVSGDGRSVVESLVRRPEVANVKLVVAVSEDVPLDDDELVLWGIFTRFDCARDVIPAATETRGAWTTCRGPLGIDATWKQVIPSRSRTSGSDRGCRRVVAYGVATWRCARRRLVVVRRVLGGSWKFLALLDVG
jgi:hypothetical protein